MRRHAVLFGSNGPTQAGTLRYAEKDTNRLANVLRSGRCDFKVRLLRSNSKPRTIEEAIAQTAQKCDAEDTFLVFFSGHGFIDHGSLLLMLKGTDVSSSLTTAVHVDDIVRSMRFCKARNKLLILDCCHAGTIFNDSRFKSNAGAKLQDIVSGDNRDSESFVALLASDRLERALEIDSIGGGFLSTTICDAIESKYLDSDIDGDGAIDLVDLREWLTRKAREHNQRSSNIVPIPFSYGRERGRLFITRDPSDWQVQLLKGPNDHLFVPLPLLNFDGDHVIAIGTTAVTNIQYQKFIKDTGYKSPIGQSFIDGEWEDGFIPWNKDDFSDPWHPVVCVSLSDAMNYAKWLEDNFKSELDISVVAPDVWDMAAFGKMYPSLDRRVVLSEEIHHKATAPAVVYPPVRKANRFGVYDLFGNVWEWTASDRSLYSSSLVIDREDDDWQFRNQELRGGSFLDDLGIIRPVLTVGALKDGARTRHSDLGFRLHAEVKRSKVSKEVRLRTASATRRSERWHIPASA